MKPILVFYKKTLPEETRTQILSDFPGASFEEAKPFCGDACLPGVESYFNSNRGNIIFICDSEPAKPNPTERYLYNAIGYYSIIEKLRKTNFIYMFYYQGAAEPQVFRHLATILEPSRTLLRLLPVSYAEVVRVTR